MISTLSKVVVLLSLGVGSMASANKMSLKDLDGTWISSKLSCVATPGLELVGPIEMHLAIDSSKSTYVAIAKINDQCSFVEGQVEMSSVNGLLLGSMVTPGVALVINKAQDSMSLVLTGKGLCETKEDLVLTDMKRVAKSQLIDKSCGKIIHE